MWPFKKNDPKDDWWKPYGSPEKAYDLDWGDAICEYVRRDLPNIMNGTFGNEWPWDDSKWAKKSDHKYWK